MLIDQVVLWQKKKEDFENKLMKGKGVKLILFRGFCIWINNVLYVFDFNEKFWKIR